MKTKIGWFVALIITLIFLFSFRVVQVSADNLLTFTFRPWQTPTFQTYSIFNDPPGTTTISYSSSQAYLQNDGGYEFLGAQSSPVISGSYTFNWEYTGDLGANGATQLMIFNQGYYPGGSYPQYNVILVGADRQYQHTNGPFHFSGQVTLPDLRAGDNIQIFLDNGPYAGDPMSGTLKFTQIAGPILKKGDINGDGTVNLTDAIMALKATGGMLLPYLNTEADVNGDNRLGIQEAIYILEYVSGIRSSATILESIIITPVNPTITNGNYSQFTATGNYSDNSMRDLTASVHWSSSDENVASISSSTGSEGLAAIKGFGNTAIKATMGEMSASTNLSKILPEPQSIDHIDKLGNNYTFDFAYPGFLQLSVNPEVSSDTLSDVITENEGNILDGLPGIGIYIVEVTPGEEQEFLNGIYNEQWLEEGFPLTPITISDIQLSAIDLFNPNNLTSVCSRLHGLQVSKVLSRSGLDINKVNAIPYPEDDFLDLLGVSTVVDYFGALTNLPYYIKYGSYFSVAKKIVDISENGQKNVINLSLEAPTLLKGQSPSDRRLCSSEQCRSYQYQQYLFFESILKSIEHMDPEVAENTVVIMSAGNMGVDLTPYLDMLAKNYQSAWGHVKFVGGTAPDGTIEHRLNSATSNMVFARGVDVETYNDTHCSGTSFSSPEVARILAYVWQQVPALSAEQLIEAFDNALSTEPIPAVPQDPSTGRATNDFLEKVIHEAQIIAGTATTTTSTTSTTSTTTTTTTIATSSTTTTTSTTSTTTTIPPQWLYCACYFDMSSPDVNNWVWRCRGTNEEWTDGSITTDWPCDCDVPYTVCE